MASINTKVMAFKFSNIQTLKRYKITSLLFVNKTASHWYLLSGNEMGMYCVFIGRAGIFPINKSQLFCYSTDRKAIEENVYQTN